MDNGEISCSFRKNCPLGDNKPAEFEIPNHDPVLIDFIRTPQRMMSSQLRKASGCKHKDLPVASTALESVTVQELLVAPSARTVTTDSDSNVRDESGHEYRDRIVYYLGRVVGASNRYRATGMVVPSPKNQEVTMIVSDLEPSVQDFESFALTPAIIEEFKVFQRHGEQTVEQKVHELTMDLSSNVTKIYGDHRRRALLGGLLVRHSILQFEFDGELQDRGWLEALILGDTGQGKSQSENRLITLTGLGQQVDGVACKRTGLAYSTQQYGSSWFLKWGAYPLNDRGLLFIDEAQHLEDEEKHKIRAGRSSGVLKVTAIRSGEHPCRVRLIFACNPKYDGVIGDEAYGIRLVTHLFADEDIRRFDFVILASESDVPSDIINRPLATREKVPQLLLPDVLRKSISWAWTRTAAQVTFTPDAVKAVFESTRRLVSTYGSARDIPLVANADTRKKVARLATALAALLHSTDETHKRIVVLPEHVQYVDRFLVEIYSHANCQLDLYSKIQEEEGSLSEDEYAAFLSDLRGEATTSVDTPIPMDKKLEIIRSFLRNPEGISRVDLAAELQVTAQWASNLVKFLRENKLIKTKHGRGGCYRATPKFVRIQHRLIAEKILIL